MRYSVRNVTKEQIINTGGKDIKETRVALYATLTPEQVNRLKALGCIVEPIQQVKSSILPPTPVAAAPIYSPIGLVYAAGINQIRELMTPPLYAEGFNVAVVGTGIRATHEQIGGSVVYQKNYTNESPGDKFDHDTGVAAIIHAVAPKCSILDMKVLDSKGYGTEEQVVQAIDDLISMLEEQSQYFPHVINLSLGGPDTGNPNEPMRAICREAIKRGIFVLASAGNSGPTPLSITSPACERLVFAVGSIDPIVTNGEITSFTISDFSSRGPTIEGLVKPDGVFFGRDIEMASSVSDTATIAKSGTSFSTPFASGAVVLFLEGEKYWGGRQTPSWWFTISPTVPPYPMTPEGLIDGLMPLAGVKPAAEGITAKDNSYGYGLPYGPTILQNLIGIRPAVDISAIITPILSIAMLGMVIAPMRKVLRE